MYVAGILRLIMISKLFEKYNKMYSCSCYCKSFPKIAKTCLHPDWHCLIDILGTRLSAKKLNLQNKSIPFVLKLVTYQYAPVTELRQISTENVILVDISITIYLHTSRITYYLRWCFVTAKCCSQQSFKNTSSNFS